MGQEEGWPGRGRDKTAMLGGLILLQLNQNPLLQPGAAAITSPVNSNTAKRLVFALLHLTKGGPQLLTGIQEPLESDLGLNPAVSPWGNSWPPGASVSSSV